MPEDDVQRAYLRGLHDGEVLNLAESLRKAHQRIDAHDGRLTALERVMYVGMGVVMVINVLPELATVMVK